MTGGASQCPQAGICIALGQESHVVDVANRLTRVVDRVGRARGGLKVAEKPRPVYLRPQEDAAFEPFGGSALAAPPPPPANPDGPAGWARAYPLPPATLLMRHTAPRAW